MQDDLELFSTPLSGLDRDDWTDKVTEIVDVLGHVQPLEDDHFATFVYAGKTLLVTFESMAFGRQKAGTPISFPLARAHGWSHLGFFAKRRLGSAPPHLKIF